ncbi:unsaturated rhamnogalacturonyl hydrolase [Paenibacillus anaericanus]|uniref:glycoside hydrolase family 88/105 protein n=1 Tax=Paenibacillus anaericanus TaxID=170367 RepID=UPI0027808CED|nr:glycoside hydrolase family 88 protein [Paenibacillus anaericanus]MDQ0086947.1 unsaturated rhamnogalacturonyl hydrolase [Paenibacillus anaericanus]
MTLQWAIKIADSIMERTPLLHENKGSHGKWSYENGVVLKGFELLWKQTGDYKYFQFIEENMDYFIHEEGNIRGYQLDEYNIDHVNNGKLLFSLYNETKQEKYKKAATLLREQLTTHPRTSEGAFWHKKIYPYQIWLDGLYMGAPFYLEYLLTFEDGQGIDDVTKQFVICEKHTKDSQTSLLYHAWDEKRVQPWCDSETGLSANFWARSMGWFVMALVDVLEIIPTEHADYHELVRMLNDALTAMKNYQDSETGVWYQVVNLGGSKGNYLEASASSMIVYAIAKGIRIGVLDMNWSEVLDRAFNGLITEFVLETKEGQVNLNKNCQVAGLGGPQGRDGSYAYYISEPIITNDFKGLGAFLQACTEYEVLRS